MPVGDILSMSTSEILSKGATGLLGSALAVISPYQQQLEWTIQILGGLLGIAVALVSLYHLIKKKK